jgi:hypothetical protein
VGVHDNFFDLGGSSLQLVQVEAALRQDLGLEISVVDLFRYSTVRALVTYLQGEGTAAGSGPGGQETSQEEYSERRRSSQRRRQLRQLQRGGGIELDSELEDSWQSTAVPWKMP